jgi:hypothetical protein
VGRRLGLADRQPADPQRRPGLYELALRIAQEGPLAFESMFRTWGYPFFLALLVRIVGPDPETVRTAGFVVQLTLVVAAAWIGAGRLSRALGMPGRAPWIYAATVFSPFIAIHAFALFDHDFPFAYISDVNPWYRWPLAISNCLFLLGAAAGLLIGLRWPLGADAARRERARVTTGVFGAATGALVVIYLPSAVESRFSLSMYPLAAPFVLAVERLGSASRGRPLVPVLVLLGAGLWVGGLAAASLWLERQAPMLQNVRATLAVPLPPSPTATYRVQMPDDWEPGQLVAIPITVTNTGPDTWSLEGFFNVAVRVQILATKTEQHRLLPKGARVYVDPTAPIAPGESVDFVATVETPTTTGRYILTVTTIRTGIEEAAPGFERPIRVDKGR